MRSNLQPPRSAARRCRYRDVHANAAHHRNAITHHVRVTNYLVEKIGSMAGSKVAALSRSATGTATTLTSWKLLKVQRNYSRLSATSRKFACGDYNSSFGHRQSGGDHVFSMCR